jgi:putative transposase
MKKKIFSEAKIIEILKAGEAGLSVSELSRKYSVGESTYYKWKAKYGGMSSADLKRLKALEKEHRRLKQMYATLSMDHELLREVLEKKLGVDLSEEI